MGDEPVLYVDDGEESRRVEELLQRKGLKHTRIRVDEKLLGWLLLEYGAKPPILVASDRVFQGREIERLVEENEAALRLRRRKGCW